MGFAQEAEVDSARVDTAYVLPDSLAVLLVEIPLDSTLAHMGDSLFVPGPGRAHILRDEYGVPHIYGETDADVAFGFGYAQAQDHLLPMLLAYRGAAGRLSEVLGEQALESDTWVMLWRVHSVAGERYAAIPQNTRNLIGAFASGVNHYIDTYRSTLPDWVEPVSGTDVVALSRWIALLLAERTGVQELAQKGLEPFLKVSAGSNQWAVGRSRAASGNPLFVLDLHLPWKLPTEVYEAHLTSLEGWKVAGVAFFGLPVIVAGHTDQFAWSLAVSDADIFDLYEEKLDPANPRRYVYEQEKERMTSQRVKIRVRQETGFREVERELLYTHHGPVYRTVEGWAYAGRTTVQDVVNPIGQLYGMSRAENMEAFQRQLGQLQLPAFHVMYADTTGRLYYAFSARSPSRAAKFDWRSPVPGWVGDTEWSRVLAFDRLPQVLDPPADFLVNCNTAPHLVTVDSGLDPTAFPAGLGWGTFNDRGRRIMAHLVSHSDLTVEKMKALARDEYLIAAEELKGTVLRAYNRAWQNIYDPEGRLALAVDLLREWDNRATADSRATLLFSVWKMRYDPLVKRLPEQQQLDVVVREKLALEALRMAVEYMMAMYGRLDVAWGEVHVVERGGQQFPTGGSPQGTDALHTTWSEQGVDGLFRVHGGSAFTMVVELAHPVRAWSVHAYGNSEDSTSVHYSDQAVLHKGAELKRTRFAEEEVLFGITSALQVPLLPEEVERERFQIMWHAQQSEVDSTDVTGEAGVLPVEKSP